jgi:hypothetical protein
MKGIEVIRVEALAASLVGLALVASPAGAARPQEASAGQDATPFDQPMKWVVTPVGEAISPAPAAAAGKEHGDSPAPGRKAKRPPPEPSPQAWQIIDWVIASHDNNAMPFMVVDKVAANVFAFDATGQMVAGAPVLVGMTVGDEATPGVGDRELSNIPPKDRKTPAGRFVAKFGRTAGEGSVLWVDYPSAISLHAVITANKKERRLQRLNSPTSDDNRITFGCINVPTQYYAKVVKPLFKGTAGLVYILPETKPLNEVFLALPPSAPTVAATQAAQ